MIEKDLIFRRPSASFAFDLTIGIPSIILFIASVLYSIRFESTFQILIPISCAVKGNDQRDRMSLEIREGVHGQSEFSVLVR
jgi:hypothetical protein